MRLLRTLSLGLLPFSLAAVAGAQTTLHLRAQIDGRSRLILSGATAQWQHFEAAAPGRLDCNLNAPMEATWIDGAAWWPTWSDLPDCENRDGNGCTSDVAVGLAQTLPSTSFDAYLNPIAVRGSAWIVEAPSANNGYRVVVEFDDNLWAGAEWYEVDLVVPDCGLVQRYCTSVINSTGARATLGALGSFSVTSNSFQLQAYNCPAGRAGIFVYGAYPTQIPFANGYLCVSPFYPGLYRAGHPVIVNQSGTTALPVDLTQLPGAAQITGGSSWNFQFWFREPVGAGSNLSDAMRITFCP